MPKLGELVRSIGKLFYTKFQLSRSSFWTTASLIMKTGSCFGHAVTHFLLCLTYEVVNTISETISNALSFGTGKKIFWFFSNVLHKELGHLSVYVLDFIYVHLFTIHLSDIQYYCTRHSSGCVRAHLMNEQFRVWVLVRVHWPSFRSLTWSFEPDGSWIYCRDLAGILFGNEHHTTPELWPEVNINWK